MMPIVEYLQVCARDIGRCTKEMYVDAARQTHADTRLIESVPSSRLKRL